MDNVSRRMTSSVKREHFCSVDSLRNGERRGVLSVLLLGDIKRSEMVDRMIQVRRSLGLKMETFFSAVNILDATLGRWAVLPGDDLVITSIAAMNLAQKYYEVYLQEISEYILAIGEDEATSEDVDRVLRQEERIFATLGCNINVPQEADYLEAILMACESSEESRVISRNLLIVTIVIGMSFLPSVVVTAIQSLLSHILDETYINYFEVPEDTVDMCSDGVILACREARSLGVAKMEGEEWLRFFDTLCSMKMLNSGENISGYYRDDLTIDLLPPDVIPEDSKKIGQGGAGVVKKVRYLGTLYAVKEVLNDPEDGILTSFLREVSIMQSLDHKNIAKIRHITSDLRSVFLDLGVSDLWAWVLEEGYISKDVQPQLADQMFSALSYMHDMGCLHRDIKPPNIIVFQEGHRQRFVLIDFGGGRGCQIPVEDNAFTQGVCTLQYRAPELLLGAETYGPAVDVWAMTVSLYQAATAVQPFRGNAERDQMIRIFEVLGTPTEKTWKGVTRLPGYKKNSFFLYQAEEEISIADGRLTGCYKRLMAGGLIMDPSLRSSARTLHNVVKEYV